MHVTNAQVSAARGVDFYNTVLKIDADSWYRDSSNSLRLKDDHSVTVKQGMVCARDWATGENFNVLDYLIDRRGYRFDEAVMAVLGDRPELLEKTQKLDVYQKPLPQPRGGIDIPQKCYGRQSRVYAYLTVTRHIPGEKVQALMKKGLLYESADKHNCVFINKNCDFAEIRGTYTYAKHPFHQSLTNGTTDKSWAFATGDKEPHKVFICEAAVDAISLNALREAAGILDNALFVSIAGVSNYQRITPYIEQGYDVVIAVDNDDAGKACRENFPDCKHIIPYGKDWNEDLGNYKNDPSILHQAIAGLIISDMPADKETAADIDVSELPFLETEDDMDFDYSDEEESDFESAYSVPFDDER